MDASNEKITLFLSAISENLDMQRKEITDEITAVRKAEQEKAEQEAARHSNAYIKAETAAIQTQTKRAQSYVEKELRGELADARTDIVNQVFDAVEKKLLAFTQTPDYAQFLEKSAANIQTVFGEQPMLLYVRPADLPYKDILLGALGASARILADETILIGGCKARGESGNLALDDTLDSRLQEQRQRFYESSGLSVQAFESEVI